MDPILHLPPDLPRHEPAPLDIVPHRVVAQWPAGTFIENLCLLPDGSFACSVLSEARLDRVWPDGTITPLHQFAAPPTGLAWIDGALFAAVGEPGVDEPVLWRVEIASGAAEPWMPITGAIFANGVAVFDQSRLLFADSWQGRLYLCDIARRTVVVWAQDERLTRAPGFDFLPGANGVKRWHNEITVSSTGRALLLRVPILADGRAGTPALLAEHLRVDDLAYDGQGTLYLTTHIGHSLDRMTRDGVRVSLGGVEQGLAGSTACAFAADGMLYVTTTGGLVGPPDGIHQAAKLVRLEVGAADD